jgi:hypothetical protein
MANISFIQYEMKSGEQKLSEALYLRGFFVEENKGIFSLVNGSEQDVKELKWLLEQCEIPVMWNDDKFQLLVNHLPTEKVSEIIHFAGRDHPVGMESYHFMWRSFVTRRFGIRISTLDNCPYTVMMAKALNIAGIVTLCGCNGHGKHQPNIRLSGVYNGIWFSIIQEEYLADLSLHYRWNFEFHKNTNAAYILAKKEKMEDWDMIKVLADCEKMSNVLLNHAEGIRALKKQCFKRNMKEKAEAMRIAGDLKGLYHWMKNIAEEQLSRGEKSLKFKRIS